MATADNLLISAPIGATGVKRTNEFAATSGGQLYVGVNGDNWERVFDLPADCGTSATHRQGLGTNWGSGLAFQRLTSAEHPLVQNDLFRASKLTNVELAKAARNGGYRAPRLRRVAVVRDGSRPHGALAGTDSAGIPTSVRARQRRLADGAWQQRAIGIAVECRQVLMASDA